MLSVNQAAEKLGVSDARVRMLLRNGTLEGRKIGGSWVISERSVAARMQSEIRPGRPTSQPKRGYERIAHRGETGGRSIEPETVARRYNTSLENLTAVIDLCDEVYLHDNTVILELEARFALDRLAYFNPAEPHLEWVARVMEALGYTELRW